MKDYLILALIVTYIIYMYVVYIYISICICIICMYVFGYKTGQSNCSTYTQEITSDAQLLTAYKQGYEAGARLIQPKITR